MSGVCGFDINEMPIRAVWTRSPRFELTVGATRIHQSWFSRLLQPLLAAIPAYTYSDSGRLPALSRG